jgi:hypothetical protein
LVELDKDTFRKKYPNLWRELDSIPDARPHSRKIQNDMFRGYAPNVIDYLRRCDRSEQAEKTISYLVEHNEITAGYAEELRKQLREMALRSFGPRKREGFYLKEAGQTGNLAQVPNSVENTF